MVSSSADETVRIWNLEFGNQIEKTIRREVGENVTTAIFLPDGQKVIIVGNCGSIRIYDVNIGKQIRMISNKNSVTSVSYFQNG